MRWHWHEPKRVPSLLCWLANRDWAAAGRQPDHPMQFVRVTTMSDLGPKRVSTRVSDLLAYGVVVAGIFAIARDDRAAREIDAIGSAYANMIRAATGSDGVDAQLKLFTDEYVNSDADLSTLETELDRKLGLRRERQHRSWFDQQLGHVKVRSREVEW